MMREAMDQLNHESERDLARALDKNQVKRLKEIQLQVEGPFAVLRPEITEKLELGEEQFAQIQEIQNESNQARRQAMAAGRTSSPASERTSRATTTSRPPTQRIPTPQAARPRMATTQEAMATAATAEVETDGAGTGMLAAALAAMARRRTWRPWQFRP